MAPYILYSRLFGLRHYSKYSIEKKREKKNEYLTLSVFLNFPSDQKEKIYLYSNTNIQLVKVTAAF